MCGTELHGINVLIGLPIPALHFLCIIAAFYYDSINSICFTLRRCIVHFPIRTESNIPEYSSSSINSSIFFNIESEPEISAHIVVRSPAGGAGGSPEDSRRPPGGPPEAAKNFGPSMGQYTQNAGRTRSLYPLRGMGPPGLECHKIYKATRTKLLSIGTVRVPQGYFSPGICRAVHYTRYQYYTRKRAWKEEHQVKVAV